VTIEWPDRRADVINALDVLAADPPVLDPGAHDPRTPGLEDAVHWLVDDTFWDLRDPAESIGTFLSDEAEAVAIRRVVKAVVAVSVRQGPTADDAKWFSDEAWGEVRAAARCAITEMRRHEGPG